MSETITVFTVCKYYRYKGGEGVERSPLWCPYWLGVEHQLKMCRERWGNIGVAVPQSHSTHTTTSQCVLSAVWVQCGASSASSVTASQQFSHLTAQSSLQARTEGDGWGCWFENNTEVLTLNNLATNTINTSSSTYSGPYPYSDWECCQLKTVAPSVSILHIARREDIK